MEFVLDLLQGIGIAAAVGVRPMLPVLLTGALASGDVGIDFDGTDFAFLESWAFLLAAARSLYLRVRRRLDAEAAGALPVYFEGAALAGAVLSILFPPLALVVVGALAWLLLGGRRREGEKYAGLRILR